MKSILADFFEASAVLLLMAVMAFISATILAATLIMVFSSLVYSFIFDVAKEKQRNAVSHHTEKQY